MEKMRFPIRLCFGFLLLSCGLPFLISCSKHSRCEAYGPVKKYSEEKGSPFSFKVKGSEDRKTAVLDDPFISYSKKKKKGYSRPQTRTGWILSKLIPRGKENSPFERRKKKEKKKEHQEGLFPGNMHRQGKK